MIDREKLKAELVRDEGNRLTSYLDTAGYWTIGVGHLLGRSRRMTEITYSESMALLEADINAAIALAQEFAPAVWAEGVSDTRRRAIVNLAFNLGNRLAGFKKFLTAVNAGDWEVAGKELVDSDWWSQVGVRGPRVRDAVLGKENLA